jgi:ferredoxin
MELSVKEFLDSVINPNTRKGYRVGIKKFHECFGCGLCASKCPTTAIELIQVRGPEYIIDNLDEAPPVPIDSYMIE